MRKAVSIVILLLATICLLTACSKNGSSSQSSDSDTGNKPKGIEGTWLVYDVKVNEETENTKASRERIQLGQLKMSFTIDRGIMTASVTQVNSFTNKLETEENSYEIKIEGNKIIQYRDGKPADDRAMEYKLDGDKMELQTPNMLFCLTRQN